MGSNKHIVLNLKQVCSIMNDKHVWIEFIENSQIIYDEVRIHYDIANKKGGICRCQELKGLNICVPIVERKKYGRSRKGVQCRESVRESRGTSHIHGGKIGRFNKQEGGRSNGKKNTVST